MIEQRICVEPQFKCQRHDKWHTQQGDDCGFIECRHDQFERMKAQRGGDIKVAVAVVYRVHPPKKREPVHRKMLQPDGEIENDKGHQGFGPERPI